MRIRNKYQAHRIETKPFEFDSAPTSETNFYSVS